MDHLYYVRVILYLKYIFEQFFPYFDPTDLIRLIMLIDYNPIKISCGKKHLCAIVNRKSYICGKNKNGQLGFGHLNDINLPHKLNLSNVKSIKCGKFMTMALTHNGDFYVWGSIPLHTTYFKSQWHHPIDDDMRGTCLNTLKSKPYKLSIPHIQKIQMTCFSDGFGLIMCDKIYFSYCHVLREHFIPNVKQIKHCHNYIIIRTAKGKLYSSGANEYGQLGLGHYDHSKIFQEILLTDVIKIESGEFHSIALVTNSSNKTNLYVWGQNDVGQLGLGDPNSRNSPQLLIWASESTVCGISCGANHTMALLKNDQLYIWGCNFHGQLGLGHYDNMFLPQKLNLNGALRIRGGAYHTMAVTTNGIYTWGSNNHGQLGLADYESLCVPTKLEFNF